MLRLLNIEELESVLTQIPGLIRLFEKKESTFFQTVKDWLEQLEKVLENNRMQACSDIAILKGSLISVERGLLPQGMEFSSHKTHRKVMDAVAVETLKKANELITSLIKGSLTQINEAERYIRQIAPLAERKGLFNSPEGSVIHRSIYLKETWQRLMADPDLGNICLHIKGLVSSQDILILLDRAMSN